MLFKCYMLLDRYAVRTKGIIVGTACDTYRRANYSPHALPYPHNGMDR